MKIRVRASLGSEQFSAAYQYRYPSTHHNQMAGRLVLVNVGRRVLDQVDRASLATFHTVRYAGIEKHGKCYESR